MNRQFRRFGLKRNLVGWAAVEIGLADELEIKPRGEVGREKLFAVIAFGVLLAGDLADARVVVRLLLEVRFRRGMAIDLQEGGVRTAIAIGNLVKLFPMLLHFAG